MKDRTITILLTVMLSLFFSIYFISLQYAIHHDGSIVQLLHQLEEKAIEEEWREAKQIETRIVSEWQRDLYLLILNYGEQDFSNMEMALSQISGAIESKDRRLVLPQIKVAINLLKNMHRIVPRP